MESLKVEKQYYEMNIRIGDRGVEKYGDED